MAEPSGILFSLRSNAKALLAGGPARSVVARLKLASLLYDYVLVEDGEYWIQGGPRRQQQVLDASRGTGSFVAATV